MDVMRAIRTEPIVSDFLVQAVPTKLMQEVVAAGHQAQSNFNSDAWRFIVVADLDRLRALSECVRHSLLMADAAFAVVPVTNDVNLLLEGQIIATMELAAWNFNLASHLCPIIDPERLRLILRIPDQLEFNTAISFGIPARNYSSSRQGRLKKPAISSVDEVVHWGHW